MPLHDDADPEQNRASTGKQIGTRLTQAGSQDVRRELLALRMKHGAQSAIGVCCSNIDEQLQNGVSPARIKWQMDHLRRLLEP